MLHEILYKCRLFKCHKHKISRAQVIFFLWTYIFWIIFYDAILRSFWWTSFVSIFNQCNITQIVIYLSLNKWVLCKMVHCFKLLLIEKDIYCAVLLHFFNWFFKEYSRNLCEFSNKYIYILFFLLLIFYIYEYFLNGF